MDTEPTLPSGAKKKAATRPRKAPVAPGRRRLYVAEKPSVARELARVLGAAERRPGAYLGPHGWVTWCIGHMGELAPPEAYNPRWRSWRREDLPMLPDAFRVVVGAHNAGHWPILQGWLQHPEVGEVVNACDAGREGELIFRYVMELAQVRRPTLRLWLNAMTDAAIRQGLRALKPQQDYDNLAAAARCRAEADWLVGLNATRAMTVARRHVAGGGELCSLGRVQTPTLAMVGGRDAAIEAFEAEPYYEVMAELEVEDAAAAAAGQKSAAAGVPAPPTPQRTANERFATVAACPPDQAFVAKRAAADPTAVATAPPGSPANPATAARLRPTRFGQKDQAEAALAKLQGALATVVEVAPRLDKTLPPQLYDLTALQREANVRFGMTAQDTLNAAQALYEQDKAITYPRTDSNYLPQAMAAGLPALLGRLNFAPYAAFVAPLLRPTQGAAPATPARIINDAEVSDHHAIVPTGSRPANLVPSSARARIYDLVVRRFVAAWMPPAQHARTTLGLKVDDVTLLGRGRVTVDEGWMAVERRASLGRGAQKTGGQAEFREDAVLPNLQVHDTCRVVAAKLHEGQTRPPPPLNEASLLGAMERAGRSLEAPALRLALKEAGLGTPATRAATIEVLKKRQYVRLEGRALVCTPQGRALLAQLPVEALKSAEMTGAWEKKLGEVARGKKTRPAFMAEVRREVAGMVQAIGGVLPQKQLGGFRRTREEPSDGAQKRVRKGAGAAAAWSLPADLACPVCRGPLEPGSQPLHCSKGRACSFVVFDKVAGRPLQAQEVEAILRGETVGPLEGFRSRQGRVFTASLRLDGDGRVAFVWA